MSVRARPLSPHLEIYRWQIGMALSILHRATGAILTLGLLALVYWLIAVAGDAPGYERAARLLSSPVGLGLMFAWTFAFFLHFFNGVRHLLWDVGLGFERGARHASGWLAVIGAILATLGVWALLWQFHRL
jgi:succinate dehydrogenase / fumarate reductase cytochrome b subunit